MSKNWDLQTKIITLLGEQVTVGVRGDTAYAGSEVTGQMVDFGVDWFTLATLTNTLLIPVGEVQYIALSKGDD